MVYLGPCKHEKFVIHWRTCAFKPVFVLHWNAVLHLDITAKPYFLGEKIVSGHSQKALNIIQTFVYFNYFGAFSKCSWLHTGTSQDSQVSSRERGNHKVQPPQMGNIGATLPFNPPNLWGPPIHRTIYGSSWSYRWLGVPSVPSQYDSCYPVFASPTQWFPRSHFTHIPQVASENSSWFTLGPIFVPA